MEEEIKINWLFGRKFDEHELSMFKLLIMNREI